MPGDTRVAVIGAGSWGTAVAAIAARNAPTVLWVRRTELADRIRSTRENGDYQPGVLLPQELMATSSLEEAVTGTSLVVMAVPSHGFRAVLKEVRRFAPASTPVLSLAKGLEQGTDLRMSEVVAQVMPGSPAGVLSGPNLAREVLAGHPAATTVAMTDEEIAAEIQTLLSTEAFRVYTNPDVVGSEIAGSTKNVIAIAFLVEPAISDPTTSGFV